jgi:hypothetical protein
MLDREIVRNIEEFVYPKPRTVQEIAQHLGKNWRTVDRYVMEIAQEFGTISTRIFREGTRGSLKIVYWASVEKISNSVFKEILEQEIMQGRDKENFSAFDIFQHVSDKDKRVVAKKIENRNSDDESDDFFKYLLNAKEQVLFFSGNLSFINIESGGKVFFDILEKLVKNGISIKVICRVDFVGKKNIEKLLSLNFKYKKELIEIRNRRQPLRATIIDKNIINLKEIKEPTGKENELNEKTTISYMIKDKEWAEWLSKIFFKMFSQSIDANKRLEQLRHIKI